MKPYEEQLAALAEFNIKAEDIARQMQLIIYREWPKVSGPHAGKGKVAK